MKKGIIEKHVQEKDLVDACGVCPLCLSEEARKPVFTIQEQPLVEWLFCDVCKGFSASMMPHEDYLKNYYQDYYSSDISKVTISRPENLAQHVAGLMPRIEADSISILDFGGGDGTVAKILAKLLRDQYPNKRFSITLVDFNQEPDKETEWYSFKCKSGLSELEKRSFDIILASAIVEHIPDVHGLLHTLFDLLRVNGVLYARTPCVTPLKKLHTKYSLKYPMHVHDLGPSFWNRVPDRYPHSLHILASKPSLVASGFSGKELLRSCIAYAFKLPAYVEHTLRRCPKDYVWKMVGGWEVILQLANTRTN